MYYKIYISSQHITDIEAGATALPFIHCQSTPASHMALKIKTPFFTFHIGMGKYVLVSVTETYK
jgi:hypothetical protein